jgi:hypothetical protein
MDARIGELLNLAEGEGLTLPYPPELILRLEEAGHVVDLATGEILLGEGDRAYRWQWTPAGEAWAHLVSVGLVDPAQPDHFGTAGVDA